MQKRHKDLMRTLVTELRHILVGTIAADGSVMRGDLDRELERLGIAPDGTIAPLDALAHPDEDEWLAHRIATAQLVYIAREQRASVRMEIVERAAYSWINRLLALRAMEARGLIDETLRNNPEYDGQPEALFILRQNEPGRVSAADGGRRAVLEDACAAQSRSLPGLFALNDPATALRPSSSALLRCMTLVGGTLQGFTLAESDAAFADPDAIGWAYQFYQEEAKARIYAKLGSGGKVATRSEIAAATQLFTEPYMVKWLLQNSLGRSYHETYPDSALPATWEYYIKSDQLDTSTTLVLSSLTLLDPCMGSGHFLREAFDMFVGMYREQNPALSASEIADCILSCHLYGIDLDPRAAQLSALTLYLRAWEMLRDERRKERKPGAGVYIPPAMNLATTPTSLNGGALTRHLQRHPHDMPYKPLLEDIFSGLEQADILGSLIRPKAYLDHAIAELQHTHTMSLDFTLEEQEVRRTITELANRDPQGLRQMLLERVADSFIDEAGNTDDVGAALFGREAERGVRLLQLLDRRYAVVVTNPPYMGSKNMDIPLKKYVEKYYPSGKRDLYATFILRCIELSRPNGRVAMVTMQSWMFLRSFAELRAVPEEKLGEAFGKRIFTGVLRETSIEALAHLGANAFEEISGEVVQSAMLVIANRKPSSEHRIAALRVVGMKSVTEKIKMLKARQAQEDWGRYYPQQADLLTIPETPFVYWLRPRFFELLKSPHRLHNLADVRQGLATADNERFLRYFWEVKNLGTIYNGKPLKGIWFWYAKGGRYQKWTGLEWFVINWHEDGAAIKTFVVTLPGTTHWSRRVASESYYFRPGLTYTLMAQGSFAARILDQAIFDVAGVSIFLKDYISAAGITALTSSHVVSYLLRVTTQDLKFHPGYTANLPLTNNLNLDLLDTIGSYCILLKGGLTKHNPIEKRFLEESEDQVIYIQALLHSLEGLNEQIVSDIYGLDEKDIQTIQEDTGIPAGWYPFLTGYDTLPILPTELNLPSLPQELFDYFAIHERISPDIKELVRLKSNLRALYEAGPGAKNVEQEETQEATEDSEGLEEVASGADIPIPTETFLEELSVKMQLHPISVYWLLEELRAEGARCRPEELRLLEGRLSVLVLRLLGHRWPKQLEVGEPVPVWANSGGIMPLIAGTGKATVAERVRSRLRAEDGELGVQQTEMLLTELTGLSLEEWLQRKFFTQHVSQFKHRPIAWHLASAPVHNSKKRRSISQRGPAFECVLYYHTCSGDALARIRTQYVEPLLRTEHQRIEDAYLFTDDETSSLAHERIQELEAFAAKLRLLEEQGFACVELDEAWS